MSAGTFGTAWCPTCRRTREVMDEYATEDHRGAYLARPLDCGHDAGDATGAPRPAPRVDDAALVAQVARLQAGAR